MSKLSDFRSKRGGDEKDAVVNEFLKAARALGVDPNDYSDPFLFSVEGGDIVATVGGKYNWIVPEGVTSVSVVCVGSGSYYGSGNLSTGTSTTSSDSYFGDKNNASMRLIANGGKEVSSYGMGGVPRYHDGGGAGGNSGSRSTWGTEDGTTFYNEGGGGGAGGYAGNGGRGGNRSSSASNGQSGTGGGGGGGGGANTGKSAGNAGAGGGVGLYGLGANGAGGAWAGGTSNGKDGSDGSPKGKGFGGGSYGSRGIAANGCGGGALGYRNNIQVTPGQVIPLQVAGSLKTYKKTGGAVRIVMNGDTRQFPSTEVDYDIGGPTHIIRYSLVAPFPALDPV